MVHQAFDIAVDLFLRRQGDARIVYTHGAGRKLPQRLLDDPHALFDLCKTHGETVVVITLRAGRHLEIHSIVEEIRLRPAHIVSHTGCAQERSGDTIGDRVFLGHHANTGHTINENTVLRQQLVTVGEDLTDVGKRAAYLLDEPGGEVLGHPSYSGIAHRQARAGNRRHQVVQGFASLQHVEADRDSAGLSGGHAQARHMVGNPRDLTHDHADVLTAVRHLEFEELFSRQSKSNVVDQWRGVIEPVGVRYHMVPGALLAHLLEAAVQVADLYLAIKDLFAVELEVELDSPVGRGVRGPHLQGHHLRSGIKLFAQLPRRFCHRLYLLGQGLLIGSRSSTKGCRFWTG